MADLLPHGADQRVHDGFAVGKIPVRAVGTEAGDRTMHHMRRGCGDVVWSESHGGTCARPPALDEHVGSGDESEQLRTLRRTVEVEHDAALAAVEHGVLDGPSLAVGVAAGRLDPRNVGAVVGKEAGRSRACGPARTIDDPQANQGS